MSCLFYFVCGRLRCEGHNKRKFVAAMPMNDNHRPIFTDFRLDIGNYVLAASYDAVFIRIEARLEQAHKNTRFSDENWPHAIHLFLFTFLAPAFTGAVALYRELLKE
jgi:hypothetical protein